MSETWHTQREQSAGRIRLATLWLLYRFFGKGILKLACIPVMTFIYPFARPAKKALRDFHAVLAEFAPSVLPKSISHFPFSTFHLYRHLLGFAWSLADKLDACTLKKNLPRMSVRDDAGARAFRALVAAKKGAFLISTHLGTIEVLPALAATLDQSNNLPSVDLAMVGRPIDQSEQSTNRPIEQSNNLIPPLVHAFQQLGHDAVFTELFMKHFDIRSFALHAVESIGVETAVEMQAAIARGDLVLMAGDRVSAGSKKTLAHDFLGRPCAWPKGVFTFAKLMESPIFFVTCVRTGWNAYEVHLKQFAHSPTPSISQSNNLNNRTIEQYPLTSLLLADYVAFLEAEVREHPEQWYQFYDFFGAEADEGK